MDNPLKWTCACCKQSFYGDNAKSFVTRGVYTGIKLKDLCWFCVKSGCNLHGVHTCQYPTLIRKYKEFEEGEKKERALSGTKISIRNQGIAVWLDKSQIDCLIEELNVIRNNL